MNTKRITIGRDNRCTIRIEERWDTVSNQHADIEEQGNSLLFYDHSSNGTIINGQRIRNTSVQIYPGDEILLAGVYTLEWSIINRYFPNLHRPTVARNIRGEEQAWSGRKTVRIDTFTNHEEYKEGMGRKTEYREMNADYDRQRRISSERIYSTSGNFGKANTYTQADIDKVIEKWNWGAFFCSWLWAICHRLYWPIIMIFIAFIPYIGQIGNLCISVYLGLNGSKWAWECGKYKDFEAYLRAQRQWTIGGVVWFLASLVATAYLVAVTLSIM